MADDDPASVDEDTPPAWLIDAIERERERERERLTERQPHIQEAA